jgi:pimeloyl-ACP methyl ester carboxylesterase
MHKQLIPIVISIFLAVYITLAAITCSPADPGYRLVHQTISQPLDHAIPGGEAFYQEIDILVPQKATESSPVFFVLGNEHDITPPELVRYWNTYGSPPDVIFVQAEHRGYGQSVSSATDQSVPAYVTVEQALADYHRVVQELKKTYKGKWMSAGYSYGGGLSIHFAAKYPEDVVVTLSSSGVIDWPFTMDAYDRQVRITMGPDTYTRLIQHINNLQPKEMFDSNWLEREFLIAGIHGLTQYEQYKSYLPVFQAAAALPTPAFMGVLHLIDDTIAKKTGWQYAEANARRSLSRDEAVTGKYGWRVWRYQQCMETGIFEVSAGSDGVFNRSKDDFFAESRALFGKDPDSAARPAWSPRSLLPGLKVPLVYVCGGMDPWQGLGLEKDYRLAQGRYFYIPDGRHCPDLSNVELGKQVLAEMLQYTR